MEDSAVGGDVVVDGWPKSLSLLSWSDGNSS